MASHRQIEANRKNAKHGGVKTEHGKQVSSQNSMKHGLLSNEVVLSNESIEEMTAMASELIGTIEPEGALEMLLTDQLIANVWRLKRALRIERAVMEWHRQSYGDMLPYDAEISIGDKDGRNMIANEDMEKVLRYEASIQRSLYRTLHELERLQETRKLGRLLPPLVLGVDSE